MEQLTDIKEASKLYSIKINADLDKRISNYVHAIKNLKNRSYSRRQLVEEAIKEKLKAWEEIDIDKIESDRTLHFHISADLEAEVLKIVQILKKLKIKTSKVDFILGAIIDKLDREEESTKKRFQGMLNLSATLNV